MELYHRLQVRRMDTRVPRQRIERLISLACLICHRLAECQLIKSRALQILPLNALQHRAGRVFWNPLQIDFCRASNVRELQLVAKNSSIASAVATRIYFLLC